MLRKSLLGVAVVLVLLAIFIATRPANFSVSRSATMAVTPAAVFNQVNDFHKWGRGDMDAFVGILYQARSITKSQGGIRGSKFAYFCSVVEDLLGLRESAAGAYAP